MLSRKYLIESFILFILQGLSLMFLISYVYVEMETDLSRDHGLERYIHFAHPHTPDLSLSDVISSEYHDDVFILSYSDNSDEISVYDPKNSFAFQNLYLTPGENRYFSVEDYRKASNCAILIDRNLAVELNMVKPMVKDVDDVLYVTDDQSSFSKMRNGEPVRLVRNLAYTGLMTQVFIEYGSQEEAFRVADALRKAGYQEVKNTTSKINLSDYLNYARMSRFGPLLYGSILMYVLVFAAIHAVWRLHIKALTIHHHHGGRLASLSRHALRLPIIFMLSGLLTITVLYYGLASYNQIIVPYPVFFALLTLHFLTMWLFHWLAIARTYHVMIRTERSQRCHSF